MMLSAFLKSTFGKAAVFYVDFIVGLMSKGFYYLDSDDDVSA